MGIGGWLTGPDPAAVVTAAVGRWPAAAPVTAPPSTQTGVLSPFAGDPQLAAITWSDLADVDADALPVTRAEAMGIPAIARARHVICSTLGRTELVAYNRAGDRLDPAPTLLVQPDTALSRFEQIVWTADDLVFHGRSVWFVLARGADNRPLRARRISPDRLQLHQRRDPHGLLRDVWTVDGIERRPDDVILIPGPHEGILAFGARTIRAAAALERTAAGVARNPAAYVELHATSDHPYTDAEIDALIARWTAARRGLNGGVAFTSRHIEVREHGAPAEHLLTAGRNAAAVDAARMVSVPADVVDASPERASMTYANAETRGRILIDYGLAAYAAAIEARLSLDDLLPHGTSVAFALDQLTRPSAEAATPANPQPQPGRTVAPQ